MYEIKKGHSLDQEIHRVEFHLRRREPHPVLVAIALGLLMVLVAGKDANAGVVPAMEIASETQDRCATQIESIQFAGTFSLKSASANKNKPLRFVIGFPAESNGDQAIAQIWSGSHCQATCSSLTLEKGDLSMPLSLDLQCRGGELGPLSAHVAVLWDHGPKPSTLLRFGTWLEGYEQASIKVEVDRFNSTNVAERVDTSVRPRKRKILAYRVPGVAVAAQAPSR
jgi:hypothetical protein